MSKLKEVYAYQSDEIESLVGNANGNSYYLKSEADKVIAGKDKAIAELRNEADIYKAKYEQEYDIAVHNEKQLSVMRIELRRQKYKRCLAMARWCESEEKRLDAIAPLFETDKECLEYNSDYWVKWHKRWLAIAEQFKKEM